MIHFFINQYYPRIHHDYFGALQFHPSPGSLRALFLLQTVRALKRRMRQMGSDLLIKAGDTWDEVPRT